MPLAAVAGEVVYVPGDAIPKCNGTVFAPQRSARRLVWRGIVIWSATFAFPGQARLNGR